MVYIFWEESIQHSKKTQNLLRRGYFVCKIGLPQQKEDVLDLIVFGAVFHTGDTVLVFLFSNIYFSLFCIKLFLSWSIGL